MLIDPKEATTAAMKQVLLNIRVKEDQREMDSVPEC